MPRAELGFSRWSEAAGDESARRHGRELARRDGLQPLPGVARAVSRSGRSRGRRRAHARSRSRRRRGSRARRAATAAARVNGSTPCLEQQLARSPRSAARSCRCRRCRPSISSPKVDGGAADVEDPRRLARHQRRRRSAPRSRPSTSCTGEPGEPGASTSPPRPTRSTHQSKRFVGSYGPGHDARAQDQRATGERALHLLLAGDLERAVELAPSTASTSRVRHGVQRRRPRRSARRRRAT